MSVTLSAPRSCSFFPAPAFAVDRRTGASAGATGSPVRATDSRCTAQDAATVTVGRSARSAQLTTANCVLQELLNEYVAECPAVANPDCDVAAFANWVGTDSDISTAVAQLLCQSTEPGSVDYLALRQRLAETRFQALRAAGRQAEQSATHRSQRRVHLNPRHVWTSVTSVAADSAGDELRLVVGDHQHAQALPIPAPLLPVLQRLERSGALTVQRLLARLPRRSRPAAWNALQSLFAGGALALE